MPQPKWEKKILLIAAVVTTITGVLALLPIRELHPFFVLLGRSVPLWIVLLVVILAISVPGIVLKRINGGLEPGQKAEQLKKFCNLTIGKSIRIEGQGSNQYLLSGRYDHWPPSGKSVWLITTPVGSSKPMYWPQGEISPGTTRNEWDARVGLGPATYKDEKMRAILAIAGECGEILFKYYLDTEDPKRPGHKLALPGLPHDVIRCEDVTLPKVQ